MATKPAAQKKPAAKPAVKKPAGEKTVEPEGVGIKELAAKLNRDPKSVRASIRRLKGGAQVGRGGRYRWESEADPAFVELYDKLSSKTEVKQ